MTIAVDLEHKATKQTNKQRREKETSFVAIGAFRVKQTANFAFFLACRS